MNKNALELLELASNELKLQKDTTISKDFKQILENMKTMIPSLIKAQTPELKSLASIFIYQLLRFLQQIDTLIVMIRLEKNEPNALLQIVSSDIRSILKQLFKEKVEVHETCGREFLRFATDRALIAEFAFTFNIQDYFKPPKAELTHLLLPKEILTKIDECVSDSDIKTTVKRITNENSLIFHNFLICDIIRYIFSAKRLSVESKFNIIKYIVTLLPNWKDTFSTFEILISLCIDILTFKRANKEDDTNVKVVIKLIKEFPNLLIFVENIARRNDLMLVSLSEAVVRCNEPKLFSRLILPTVEPEAPKVNTEEALKAVLTKIKWQKKDVSNVLTEFSSQIINNLLPCYFDIPFTPSNDLLLIVKSGSPPIIASVCEKNSNILKSSLFLLKDDPDTFAKVLEILSKTDAVNFMIQAISKVLVIAPELLKHSLKVISTMVPKEIDPSPIIRFICYNCTGNELYSIINPTSHQTANNNYNNSNNNFIFPSVDSQVLGLIKQSLKWRDIPQNVFWIYLNAAFQTKHMKNIIDALESTLPLMSHYPVAFSNMKVMMQRLTPSPQISKLTEVFMRGNDELQNAFLAIINAWCRSSKDETVTFIQNRLKSFRAFLDNLTNEQISRVPEPLMSNLFPKSK
ncbi:hypothetical protein TRFO_15080 [Tritrichomonas foetus]|uniref:Uncharacterized protein n=1 Tax=Tritrichomonas foetus TaxID=1144522 RepID=A0A1J4KYA9_9EUKA|nr:hypothetical protein TRFO_15080 [Tritrichomonas foetus]|eukprot:OHT14541.1 hypothetical protein TRFO_15080 [Tritrichomonas foetus]